jgi:hypothetical protein
MAAFSGCSSLTEIIVKAETPPAITSPAFGNPFNGSIHVLCNKEETYKTTTGYWPSYADKIQGDVPPDITLESNDETMGKPAVTKKNTTCADNTAIIEATAFPDYHFVQWNDGSTDNPRNITVTENVTFTATFKENVSPILLQDLEDAIVCIGESHTFEIVAEGDYLRYEWYRGDSRITGANGNTYTVTDANSGDYGNYHAIVRTEIGDFKSSVYSKNVRLWVADQLPETLSFVSCPVQAVTGQSYRIRLAGYSDVTQYVWNYDRDDVTFSPATGGVGNNETLATFGILSEGLGTLTVTLTHPCGARQATQAIKVQFPAGVDQVAEQAVRVSPNPTSGIIHISGTKANQIIRIVDITGSLKGTYPARDGETTIDLSGFTKGTYLVQYDGKTVKAVKK